MTTGSSKKTPKNPKSGKASTSRARRKKVVDKAPSPVAIDKEKMAAFFSAAGIDDAVGGPVKELENTIVETVEDDKTKVVERGLENSVKAATTVDNVDPGKSEDPIEVAVAGSVNDTGEVLPESDSGAVDNSNNLNGSEGEIPMTTTPKASGNGSGSFNLFSMFFILVVMALFWLYYISSTPLQKAAEVQARQKQAEISTLATKIKSLESENSKLQNKLNQLEKVVLKQKKAAQPDSASVKVEKLPVKPAVIKAIPKAQSAVPDELERDTSFDKAPVPFWRNMKPRGSLIKQAPKKVKSPIKTSAPKVDSFSKAPKPFWLKSRVKPAAAKAKAEKKAIIAAPPVARKCPSKARKVTPQSDTASNPALDPSFEKAPKPFWLK